MQSPAVEMLRAIVALRRFNRLMPDKAYHEPIPENTRTFVVDIPSAEYLADEVGTSRRFMYVCLAGVPVKRAADVIEYVGDCHDAPEQAAYAVKQFARSCGAWVDDVEYMREYRRLQEHAA